VPRLRHLDVINRIIIGLDASVILPPDAQQVILPPECFSSLTFFLHLRAAWRQLA
jgi:hypothetical protein